MKKKVALLLVLAMVMFAFAACGGGGATEEEPPVEETPVTGGVQTGMAVLTSAAGSADGAVQVESLVAAVTVDEAGKIVNCTIDQLQTKIELGTDGKVVTPLDTAFATKNEIGANYGMAKASSIGKEWNEQAAAFAAYVTGKTVDEVKGIAISAEGVPTDADLASSVTLHIGDFIAVVEKAVGNAQDLGASAEDTLGLGIVSSIAGSKDAADADGLAQAYTYYTATTFNADGVITSSIIDSSQTNISFSKEGKITTDINAAFQTKNELGANYGMAKASSIGKEWNEQAAAFAAYVTGKTLEEVKGIAVAEGVPSGDDLKSSVTVHIGDFQSILDKAFKNAK